MGRITLDLPDPIAAELAEAGRQAGQTADELAADLVRRGLAVRGFRAARQAVLDSLGDTAPATDEDAMRLLR